MYTMNPIQRNPSHTRFVDFQPNHEQIWGQEKSEDALYIF